MKKKISFIMAILMVISCVNLFSVQIFASTEKLNETFSSASAEELAMLTADDAQYDVGVTIRFQYEDIDISNLMGMGASERAAALKAYYGAKNEKLIHRLHLKNCTASSYAPFAEIIYGTLEEYYAHKSQLQKISRKKVIDNIEATILVHELQSGDPNDGVVENPQYSWAQVKQDIGFVDNDYNGSGIKIGVIEDGKFASNQLANPSNYECSQPIPQQSTWAEKNHAAGVLTIIGASQGIAPGASIYHHHDVFSMDTIEDLLDEGVDIINYSAGTAFVSEYDNYSAYVDYIIYTSGVVFVKSAGNTPQEYEGGEDRTFFVTSPAHAINAVVVGATNVNKQKADFSRYGSQTTGVFKPDLMAPGDSIALPDAALQGREGTSFSTPIVSAIIARLMHEFPQLRGNPALVKAVLAQGCTAITGQNPLDFYVGAGLVNYSASREILQWQAYAEGIKAPNTAVNTTLCSLYGIIYEGTTIRVRIYGMVPQSFNTNSESVNENEHSLSMSIYKISIVNATTGQTVAWGTFYGGNGCYTFEAPYTGTFDYYIRVQLYSDAYPNATERVVVTTDMELL